MRELAYMNPAGATGVGTVNSQPWLDHEVPSANMHANAEAIARGYAALIDPARPLLARETLDEAITVASDGDDRVLARHSRFGLHLIRGASMCKPNEPELAALTEMPVSSGSELTRASLAFG
jgi:hypothetical protein